MANLNLSQFTEKTLVADADWTFVWDTAGSISKKVSRNNWLNSGELTTSAPVTISQTWNGTGSTVFKALVVNATTPGTTSSASSLLLDLQVGGVTTASINKAGQFFAGSPTQFLSLIQADAYIRNASTGRAASLWAEECRIVGGPLVFSDSPNVNTSTISAGVALYKEAANTLALRNGAAAQTFNVYGTSSSSNTVYERMFAKYNGTDLAFQIGTETAGATLRPLDFVTGGSRRMTIGTTGNVGIGTTAPTSGLHISGALGTDGGTYNSAAAIKLTNTTVNSSWLLTSGVVGVANAHFCIRRESVSPPALTIAGITDNVGIGTTAPSSKLQVTGGDVEIETVTSGIIMKAAGTSTRYRITLNAGGTALVFTAI
jgi:hypothetical protein